MGNILKSTFRYMRSRLANLLSYLPCDSTIIGPPRYIINSSPIFFRSQTLECRKIGRIIPLLEEQTIARTSPLYADPAIKGLFDRMTTGISKKQFVVQLERGRYWGRSSGYIINSKDYLHRDISPSFDDISLEDPTSKRHDAMLQPLLPRIMHISGKIAAINTLQSVNFHHWLLDCVPKFGLIKAAGFNLSSIDHFIIPSPIYSWHKEILEYLDIPLNKTIPSTSGLHIRADDLIIPSFSEPSRQPHKYNYTTEGLMFVRDLLLSRSVPTCQYPERIIISRERTKCRRLIDGNQIASRLELYGFKKIILEDYTLAEQARFFNSAKTIIMPTGGGLANFAFCQPGTKIIELFSPFYLPTFSLLLANTLELNYIALVGESEGQSIRHSDLGGSRDIKVSYERILQYAEDQNY